MRHRADHTLLLLLSHPLIPECDKKERSLLLKFILVLLPSTLCCCDNMNLALQRPICEEVLDYPDMGVSFLGEKKGVNIHKAVVPHCSSKALLNRAKVHFWKGQAAKALSMLKKCTTPTSQGKSTGTRSYIMLIIECSGHHVWRRNKQPLSHQTGS